MFGKLFKKHKKDLHDSIIFNYDDQNINSTFDFSSMDKELHSFIDLLIEELQEEHIASYDKNTITITHKNVYKIENDFKNILKIPALFTGSVKIKLQGLINQGNATFSVELFDENLKKIIPYKVVGSILYISRSTQYLLAENLYDIFCSKERANEGSEYEQYTFIELLQNDKSGKISFDGLNANDRIESVKNIDIDITEDEEHNLILSPKISNLPPERTTLYEHVIDQTEHSLLIPDARKDGITRFALDDKRLRIAQAINKRKKIPKEKAGLFLANPVSHFEDVDEDLKEEFEEKVFANGYRIIGIGEPYSGYFGSLKTETPLSEVLKSDPSFEFTLDTNEVNDFIESNANDLSKIQKMLKRAIDEQSSIIEVSGKKLYNHQYPKYLKMVTERIKKDHENDTTVRQEEIKQVLLIDPNDEQSIEHDNKTRKTLANIEVNNIDTGGEYNNFVFTPFPHQAAALNWMVALHKNRYPGCLLADDMGLGKTFEVISFIDHLKRIDKDAKILIVAPTVLIDNWENEFKQSLKDLIRYNIKAIRGKHSVLDKLQKLTRQEMTRKEVYKDLDVITFLEETDIFITTYKTMQKYQFAWVVKDINLKCVVYDEAQNIKNPNALQTQAAKAISSEVPFNILMTGTPIENELRDIWCLFDVFDPTFFGSWKQFRKTYVSSKSDNIEQQLREKISNYMLRRLKQDILDGLPKKYEPKLDESDRLHYPAKEVVFNSDEAQQYLDIIQNDIPALSKLLKLRHFSMHPYLIRSNNTLDIEGLQKKMFLEEFTKTQTLIAILNDIKRKNEKVIIFVISKSMQLMLQYALKSYYELTEVGLINGDNNKSSTRESKLKSFKDHEGFNVIILSPLAAGVGLTINEANHVIHFERHWNPAKEDQASDRIYRIGQKKDVFIHHLISKLPKEYNRATFDEGLNQLILNKKALSSETLIPSNAVNDEELINSIFGTKGIT